MCRRIQFISDIFAPDALIISDVQGNHMQDISSGCTAPDCTSFDDALHHIRLLHLESAMPKSVMMQLRNGASGIIPDGPSKTRVKNHIIASGLDCAKAVTKKAKLSKLRVHIMQVYGDVKSESEKIVSCTKSGENSCVVFYGEPTVNPSSARFVPVGPVRICPPCFAKKDDESFSFKKRAISVALQE